MASVICTTPGNLLAENPSLALRNVQVSRYTEIRLEVKWLCYIGKGSEVSKP